MARIYMVYNIVLFCDNCSSFVKKTAEIIVVCLLMFMRPYNEVHSVSPGPSCSELMSLLVNVPLKFQTLVSQNKPIFFVEKV